MNKILSLFLASAALGIAACTATEPAAAAHARRPGAAFRHSQQDVAELGRRIWANECAGSVPGLVSWNAGEDFPSLGIGHFIWFPRGVNAPFEESFPSFVRFARVKGVQVPAFFDGPAPWPNKAAFLADRSGRAEAMRQWLAQHVDIQTRFIIQRSYRSLNTMMQASRNPRAVQEHYHALFSTPQGTYCLVDYVNFKGEGTNPNERYKGQGWGLLQVLEEMEGNPQGSAATAEFSRAAAAVLRRRVANAPAARGEQRWLAGWLNRCATYR